ncbi:lipopolysaccharide export system protein LptC [Rhizobium petrolearium]|uniref:LPS export ABC transporter periplasmic protein LptC n=1 Tax=Neorhizobium petrolearium TaxID=515361 RepID=UPI001AE77651|nr:LPS export ABC transporter periplasmic protein LptC [Neorhizobium petrolearium]MBP1841884.1 lipopolysaccharide export system protein LptC [Neorhizobium petrolearium]
MLQHIRKTAGLVAALEPHADAYQAALAHSALVRKLKILLPVAAGLISIVFIGVSIIRAYLPEDLSIESARIENGKIVMERPAISGRNNEGISYSMIANRALQDIQNPNMITLEDVKAAVPINDDVIARVTATGADFDRGTDMLDLTAPFDVNLSNGITARFKSAHLDVNAGFLDTRDPVDISMKEGSIVADSLKITDKGRIITFIGQVRVHLDPATIRNQGK